MNKNTFSGVFAWVVVITAILTVYSRVSAQVSTSFSRDLSYGMNASSDVIALQQFLNNQGFSVPVTGNFYDLTAKALKNFQKARGIQSTGNFGPITRAAANSILATAGNGAGNRASFAFTKYPGNRVEAGQTQTINWTSSDSVPTVAVNLIRKVSDNPARYELVRTIAKNKTNNGSATWVPAVSDTGAGLTLEIACTHSNHACQAGENTSSVIAVVNTGRFANTASAYQAIEAAQNK